MRKENTVQLEIFPVENSGLKPKEKSKSFFTFIWGHEKIILGTLFFLLTGIVSFTLGFERGKKQTFSKAPAVSDITNASPVKEKITSDLEVEKPQELPKKYTIQVATYKSKTIAQKEAQFLKVKGYKTSVFSKNNYIQLCVGQFSSKDEAKTSLTDLKKRYQDCFIRRL